MKAAAVVLAAGLALAGGCTAGPKLPDDAARRALAAPAAPFSFAVTPADNETKVPASAEVGIQLSGGSVESVAMVDSAGQAVPGRLREDASSWVPDKPLRYGARYTATVTAVGSRLHRETRKVNFTTMPQPSQLAGVGFYMSDGQQYGIGMPVALEFPHAVPANMRAAVQRRFFVTSDPPQPGAWHWFSGTTVQYRPAQYWHPGTKLSVRIALKGQPLGDGYYGDQDSSATATIAKDIVEMRIFNSSKQMKMYKNGKLMRTMPVSLGKSSTPSSSGHMVIMEKASRTTFDTRGDPLGGYVVDVDWAMRLTWGGEFIHSAPWSVGDQGNRNVSHGCVNLAPGNASWLFGQTHIGDPVTVTGTEVKLANGNGWTVWDMNWENFVKGSAIPVTKAVAQAAAYEPYPEPSKSPAPAGPLATGPTPAPSHS
jgi:lipoprotein-anchoring transpeptidase ErfK/SrfK